MPIDVYCLPGAAPTQTVLLTAAALNLEVNIIPTDVRKGENLKPEFLKINPQHTIPTLVDNGFAIWESRAIARYLVNKYGKNSSLYPEDVQARAVVDQRLDFDLGTLYLRFANYFYPQILQGTPADEALLKKLEEALGFLNTFLEGHKYAAGNVLTLADLSLVATVSALDIVNISFQTFPNVVRWYELVKSTAPKFEEVSEKGKGVWDEVLEKLRKS